MNYAVEGITILLTSKQTKLIVILLLEQEHNIDCLVNPLFATFLLFYTLLRFDNFLLNEDDDDDDDDHHHHHAPSVDTFKTRLKTFLFASA